MNKDLIKKEKKIINEYGVPIQLKYFQSEVFELNEAIICREIFYNYDVINDMTPLNNNIAEEIADVMVMLKQFQSYYEISDKDIEKIMSMKINRQIDRIKKERANK